MQVRGFAELMYRESARLGFARACERVEHDAAVDHPNEWVIDDRRISFALDRDLSPLELQLYQRLLEELLRDAASGEVMLTPEGRPRWAVSVGHAASGVPGAPTSHVEGSAGRDADDADTDITAVRFGVGRK